MADEVIDNAEVMIPHGKKLEWSDDGEGSWTKLPGSVNISLPERELSSSEITNDDSPGFHKEFTLGMIDPGKTTISYKFTESAFEKVEEVFQLAAGDAEDRADATKVWRITYPSGSTWTFSGFITSHGFSADGSEEVPDVEFEIQVTGQMTFAKSTGS